MQLPTDQSDDHDVVTPDRIIELSGGQNFREIGGYPARDGRRLRRGQLWRSAKLDELTSEDIEIIRPLRIATIADLRRPSERAKHPTHPALLEQAKILCWDVDGLREQDQIGILAQAGLTLQDYFARMLELYRGIPELHVTHLADLYAAVAAGETPVLIHCAAGKDRTGIAVGFLLEVIGIERRHILSDYAKTEQLLDWTRLTKSDLAGTGASREWVDRFAPDALDLLKRSDARYLAAVLEDIDSRYGSVERFVIDRLGLSLQQIDEMRDHLLEPA